MNHRVFKRSFLALRRVEIQAHNFKGQPLLLQLVALLETRLVDHGAEIALLPFLVVSLLPKLLGLFQ